MDSAQLKVETIFRKNGLNVESVQMSQLSRYVELLLDWNSKINLISRADVENIWFSHILHSLSILFFIDFAKGVRIVDLGTGGGLPGIPIAIMRPDVHITLLDSIRKKTMVVQNIVEHLALSNADVITGRAEEIAKQKECAHVFDIVISRAVAPLIDLLQWSKPLLKKPNRRGAPFSDSKVLNSPCLLTLKGGDLSAEIETAKIKSNLKQHSVINLTFNGSEELGLQDKKIIIVPF